MGRFHFLLFKQKNETGLSGLVPVRRDLFPVLFTARPYDSRSSRLFSFVPLRRKAAHTQQSEIADGQRPVIIGKILILKQVGKTGRVLRLENIHIGVKHVFCRLLSLSSRWIIVFSVRSFKSRFAQIFV